MKSLLFALVFGVLFTTINYAQDKKEKGCCSSDKSKTMSKICDVPDEVSLSPGGNTNITESVTTDDRDKKTEKNVKEKDKCLTSDKSKVKSSGDGCCSTDKKKTEKTKTPKS